MNKKNVKKLNLGLYRIFWKEGGMSLASVGNDHYGNRWYAPANWISGPSFDWKIVKRVEIIEACE